MLAFFSCLFPMASVFRGETFHGGFRRLPFVPGASCDPEVLLERVDVVADGPSSEVLRPVSAGRPRSINGKHYRIQLKGR